MEWITAISQLLGHLAWPAVLITFVVMFRREIRQRLTAVTEVKYPGGAIIMREVERLEAKVEDAAVSPSRQLPQGPAVASVAAPHSDSRLAIAQMRLDTERELFLLSRHALHRADVAGWPAHRYIEELEKARVLDPSLVDNVRDFVDLANKIVHDAAIPDGIVQRAAAVGSSLVATLRHKRLVLVAERDFEGHGLWHMHALRDEERDEKYYIWSAVAASLPEFDYDYDVYREAVERFNEKVASQKHPGQRLYVLSLEEFVAVLEFRESELLRIIYLWQSGKGWDKGDRSIEWQWPSEWGHIGWSGPILRERVHLWGAEEDLMRTRAALATYRPRVLAVRRVESK